MRTTGLLVPVLFLAAPSVLAGEQFVPVGVATKVSSDPTDPVWEAAKKIRIPLSPQNLVFPHGGQGAEWVEVSALRSPDEIAFRVSWPDKTRDSKLELSGKFVDACALQFPVAAAPGGAAAGLPSPFMGEKGKPVNIWRWSAAMQERDRYPKAYSDYHRPDAIENTYPFRDQAEDLVAEGFWTLGRRQTQAVEAQGAWADGRWTVVFKRRLDAAGGGAQALGGAIFAPDKPLAIAAAIWDGAAWDRDGAKTFSAWHTLHPAGSPPVLSKDILSRGRRVYDRYGCGTCHGADAKGGVPNPGAQTDPMPALERVAEGFTEDEVKEVIRKGRQAAAKDPSGAAPRFAMNSWSKIMEEDELDALADYLFSLMPKEGAETW